MTPKSCTILITPFFASKPTITTYLWKEIHFVTRQPSWHWGGKYVISCVLHIHAVRQGQSRSSFVRRHAWIWLQRPPRLALKTYSLPVVTASSTATTVPSPLDDLTFHRYKQTCPYPCPPVCSKANGVRKENRLENLIINNLEHLSKHVMPVRDAATPLQRRSNAGVIDMAVGGRSVSSWNSLTWHA